MPLPPPDVAAPQILVKQPGESVVYSMDFLNLLAAGESLAGVSGVTASPSGPTISSETISGTEVVFRVAGGTNGVDYRIAVTVTTNLSNTRIADGVLRVRD